MIIITFWGGLGNQLFEYAYYKWLENRFPYEKIYSYFPAKGLAVHNGLEIMKRFDVTLPPTSKLVTAIGDFIFNVNRILRRLHLPLICTCTQSNVKYRRWFHCDYWQDKQYVTDSVTFDFRLGSLGEENLRLLEVLKEDNVVAVHIRRGDYLENKSALEQYGGICAEDYYQKAMEYMQSHIANPCYVFFSDDPEYVKGKYVFEDMIVVDWNKGEDSFYDMFLMSQCKNLILANSTFSYWAARLNHKGGIICCPPRWTNYDEPDIILSHWIKIN